MTNTRKSLSIGLCLLPLALPGCGYGEIDPIAYEQVKSLYMVCNQKNEVALEKVAQRIATERESGALSAREANWLEAIIDEARDGEWQIATARCRHLMEAQVKR